MFGIINKKIRLKYIQKLKTCLMSISAEQVSILFVKNLTLIKVSNSSDSLFTWAEFDWFEFSKDKYDSDFIISSCTPILIIKISDGYDLWPD